MSSGEKRDLRARVRDILAKLGRPTTEKDLVKMLRVKGDARLEAKRVLSDMLAHGELARTRADRLGLPEKMNLVAGRLECKSGGFGFVRPDRSGEQDVYVAGAAMGEAVHGDRVLVRVERTGRGGKREGRIVEVLERATRRLVGRLETDGGASRVVPFDSRFLHEIMVPSGAESGARPKEMVVVELTKYPAPFSAPIGQVTEVLGSVDEPGVDVRVIIAKHELPDAFPEEVLKESERIPTEVPEAATAERTDFRSHDIVTIDGETARDFDDAVRVERLPNGNYRLGVHIADVGHYVTPGSGIDREAFRRGTSVYFPERALPMLPERLSNGICSLNPGVDRLVQSVCIEVDPNGRLVDYAFYDGVIRSAARMTYTDVRKILVDRDPDIRTRYEDLLPLFETMLSLYKILRARRESRGSIDFDLPEPEILLDVEGLVTGIVAAERNVAHNIIEEFMLLANEVVATHLQQMEVPSLYRVHEKPDADQLEEFEEMVTGLGFRLRGSAERLQPRHFQRLLKRIEGKPEERLISYLMLRAMKQARYDMDNSGHYALATPIYTHFTSPIRRYPDLVVHRLLREVRELGPPPADVEETRVAELPDVAAHCSMTERRADSAERELVEWKKVRFMADKLGDVFVGYVTGVQSFGLFVELEKYFVEGLVHISTLVDDYYRFNEKAHTLRGESSGKTFRLGDRLEVQVVRVSLEARQIDLAIEGMRPDGRPPRSSTPRRKHGGRRGRAGRKGRRRKGR